VSGFFILAALFAMLAATAWLIASLFFRKNRRPLSERVKKWWQVIHDAFWGMG
jgi:uncharacterized protein involved in response to NO